MNLIIALIGKENSGKSTTFNQLIQKNIALISSIPNFTRDRQYAVCTRKKCNFIFIDTPAIDSGDFFSKKYKFNKQSVLAIQESHIIFFIIKYEFNTTFDNFLQTIHFLKKIKKKFFVIINLSFLKYENEILKKINFLGIQNQVYLINCKKKLEINKLFNLILYPEYFLIKSSTEKNKNKKNYDYNTEQNIFDVKKKYFNLPKIIILGRPNSGKSTLMNSLLNAQRASVSNIAGTTRDSLCAMCTRKKKVIYLLTPQEYLKKIN
nr:GTPase [Wigglesworthia glossinidia]